MRPAHTHTDDQNISPVDAADGSTIGSPARVGAPPSSPSTASNHSQGALVTAPLLAASGQASAVGAALDATPAASGPAAQPRPQQPGVGMSPAVPGQPAPPGGQGAQQEALPSVGPGPAN